MSVAKLSNPSIGWINSLSTVWKIAPSLPVIGSTGRHDSTHRTLQVASPMATQPLGQACVVDIIQETADTKTFVLHQADGPWQGRPHAKAGQYVHLSLAIDGQPRTRTFSLTSRPGARQLALTVQRQPGGWVSQYLHQQVKVGDQLSISEPRGEFVLPRQLPEKILLLSAGIGITAVMAMLLDLQHRNFPGDLAFFHVCKHPTELIFAKALSEIEAQMPTLSLIKHFVQESGPLTPQALRYELPDLAQRSTWMCGPTDMLDTVQNLWRDESIAAPLHAESYATDRPS